MTTLYYLNPESGRYANPRFILCFGAYGDTHIAVHADCLDDALDECVDYIAKRWPGMLCNDSVNEAYQEAYAENITEGMDEDEAAEKAAEESEVDVTRAGNAGDCILSYEWGIVSEDADRALIKSYDELEVIH